MQKEFFKFFISLVLPGLACSINWIENGTDLRSLKGRSAALYAKFLSHKSRDRYLSELFILEKTRLANLTSAPGGREAPAVTLEPSSFSDEDFDEETKDESKEGLLGTIGNFAGKLIDNVKKFVKDEDSSSEVTTESKKSTVVHEVRLGKKPFIGRRLYQMFNMQFNQSDATDPAVKMKINNRYFYALFTPGFISLAQLFIDNGHDVRICGGVIRDLLHKKLTSVSHVDLSTTAKPEQMKEMIQNSQFRIMYTKGQQPHTFVLRISGVKYKITTLRNDVYKPGLSDTFIVSWKNDAASRDFTCNALYLGLNGFVYDYFTGCEDIKNKRIRFIGEPADRIKQDYMRILRYFRFFGKLADDPDAHDQEILQAIRQNAHGLRLAHGSRMWKEFQKVFHGNFVEETVKTMLALGLGEYLGLGSRNDLDLDSFERLCRAKGEGVRNFITLTYVGALFKNSSQAFIFNRRMKLLRSEHNFLQYVITNKDSFIPKVVTG